MEQNNFSPTIRTRPTGTETDRLGIFLQYNKSLPFSNYFYIYSKSYFSRKQI